MSSGIEDLRLNALVVSLRSSRLFAGLPPSDVESIARIVTVRMLAKGDYLFHEGDPSEGFYLVQKGAINVHRVSPAGKEQVIQVFRAGDSFAEATLATESGYPADARAVENSQVLLVQKVGILALLRRHPELALRMLASMSAHLRILVGQLDDLTMKDVETRLTNWLIKRCPNPQSTEPALVELKMTKRTLAAELGTVSETLSRTLAKLRAQKLIDVRSREILVHSPAQIAALLERHLGG